MSVETLQIIALIFFLLSGALFVIAVCLFFAFNIPGIVGNLSGFTAKKAIEDIKAKNEKDEKVHISYSRIMRGKSTEKVAGSSGLGRLTGPFRQGKSTKKLGKAGQKTELFGKKEIGETVRLDTVEVKETTILSTNVEEVMVPQFIGEPPIFIVDVDIVLCESAETIE